MKPIDQNFVFNALVHGVAGLNIDACRIGTGESLARPYGGGNQIYGKYSMERGTVTGEGLQGRWPANVLLDEEAAAALDQMSGVSKSTGGQKSLGAFRNGDVYGKGKDIREPGDPGYGDTGGASRFFYVAKASKRDRDEGLEGMEEREAYKMSGGVCIAEGRTAAKGKAMARNHHPTVKPTQLMRYLVRLVTPANGIVLDPFMGSGSTGKAAMLEGFNFVGIEKEAEYLEIARRRIEHAQSTAAQVPAQPALLEVA